MKDSDLLHTASLIASRVRKTRPRLDLDECLSASLLGVAIAMSRYRPDGGSSEGAWLHRYGYSRTIDVLRENRVLDQRAERTRTRRPREIREADMPAADDGDKSIIETKAAREDAGGLDAEVLRTIFAASPKRDKFVRVFAAIYLDGRKLAELGHPAAYVHKMGLAFLRGRAATVARQFGMEASS